MMPKANIFTFHSFEEQLLCFKNKTGVHLPRMTCGRITFFRDFIYGLNNYGKSDQKITLAHILPNPAHGLSFPNAADVLSSALCLSRNIKEHSELDMIQHLLETFGLPKDKATQSVTSLSGGELLLLGFAKANAMLPSVDGLVACSPTYWLNEQRYIYWNNLVNNYLSNGKYVDVLLLEGEPFPDNSININDDLMPKLAKDVKWEIQINEPEILFDEIQFPTYHPASIIKYFAQNKKVFELISPTLLTGDNGVGKSVFSKILSRVKRLSSGDVTIKTPNGQGGACLLFQNSIEQLFGKSIDDHLDWVFRFEEDKRKIALSIYKELDSVMRVHIRNHGLMDSSAVGELTTHNTLLQAKMSLVAERLASVPPLLILDEPGWGLSRSIARKFVYAVCKQASKYGVAILLISHQLDCWKAMIKSHLHLTKEQDTNIRIEKKDI